MTTSEDSTTQSKPKITQQCENFRDYLQTLGIRNFGEFICGATFSLEKFQREMNDAGNAVSFRIYYGCDNQGMNHTLYIAFLDQDGNVIRTNKFLAEPLQQDDKCPPGEPCQNDAYIGGITN